MSVEVCSQCQGWGIMPDGCPRCRCRNNHEDRCRCEKPEGAWGQTGFHWIYRNWNPGIQDPGNLTGPAVTFEKCQAYRAARR